ncbi:twin-arginine translocase TatA/TatE family subunit [Deinococcus arenicola]|uniref:Sec-independent protein translocase protein TatA n=1 Tax=Deinococcus arenicola TaxID=2994950 RepID=A0ABU4DVW4_9DEIO|nr:twin-arginine translocase TatA/TatE family subunit [Deinococcus sp. ZS9-10]MDV6376583.1 twin-arginine translocase TatA/TatE family subunit [Deinococcus sp. ZS9-10]
MSLGPMEIVLVLVVVLLIFGAKKLPQIGKDLGAGLREFKNSGRELMHSADQPSDQRREE